MYTYDIHIHTYMYVCVKCFFLFFLLLSLPTSSVLPSLALSLSLYLSLSLSLSLYTHTHTPPKCRVLPPYVVTHTHTHTLHTHTHTHTIHRYKQTPLYIYIYTDTPSDCGQRTAKERRRGCSVHSIRARCPCASVSECVSDTLSVSPTYAPTKKIFFFKKTKKSFLVGAYVGEHLLNSCIDNTNKLPGQRIYPPLSVLCRRERERERA